MANEMIKFYKGLEASLPAAGTNGALYITTDEGAIYLGTGTGMKRLGDFVQVDNVASLPAKAHESCLYYCVAENILAKWNGAEWKQINKQPTAEEMKTLLGLGSMAYKSEVSEGDLNAALLEKVNASAEGNHSHSNKGVLDGITAEKVAAWDASEQNAKDHANGLDSAMDTRVKALEAIDHEHSNKALLDTYTQTEADLADAVAKKHEHSNKTELDKIVAGDVAKWNGVVADHLVAADKAELADSIGDVNTALETYKTSNDKALAGVKATADAAATKEYADAELAKKVDKTDYEADKATFATKTEIAKLAGVSEGANRVEASETNGNIKIDGVETVVYTHPDKHAIADVTGLQEALDGKQAAGDYSVNGHKHVKADITDFAHTHTASEITDLDATIKGYDYATKTELGNIDAKFANYKTAADQKAIDDEQDRRLGVIEGDYLKAADIANFETKANVKQVADDLAAYVESNDEALAGVKATAEAARTEDEVNSQIDTKIAALNLATTYEPIGAETRAKAYVDGKFTEANLDQYTTEQEVKDIVDGVIKTATSKETLDSLVEIVEYLDEHTGAATEMAGAITVLEGKVETIEGKPAYGITATQISNWDNEVGAKALADTKTTTAEVKTQIEAYGYATTGYADGKASAAQSAAEAKAAELDAALKTALQGEIDADVKVVNDALEGYKTSNNAAVAKKANSADVYAKTETYTQAEVDAAIEAAVTEACSWGSF